MKTEMTPSEIVEMLKPENIRAKERKIRKLKWKVFLLKVIRFNFEWTKILGGVVNFIPNYFYKLSDGHDAWEDDLS